MYTTSTIFDVTEIRSELRPVPNGGYVRELRIQDTYNNVFAIQCHGDSALRLELPEGGQAQLRRIAEREAEKYLTALARIYALDDYATLADARKIVAEYLDAGDAIELASGYEAQEAA
jgi:hypothetical protein